jgi:hypothetical protein
VWSSAQLVPPVAPTPEEPAIPPPPPMPVPAAPPRPEEAPVPPPPPLPALGAGGGSSSLPQPVNETGETKNAPNRARRPTKRMTNPFLGNFGDFRRGAEGTSKVLARKATIVSNLAQLLNARSMEARTAFGSATAALADADVD